MNMITKAIKVTVILLWLLREEEQQPDDLKVKQVLLICLIC